MNVLVEEDDYQLPGGESNPGLPRDRRGYLPLYYRGHDSVGQYNIHYLNLMPSLLIRVAWLILRIHERSTAQLSNSLHTRFCSDIQSISTVLCLTFPFVYLFE